MERAIKDLNLLQKDIDEMSRQMLEKKCIKLARPSKIGKHAQYASVNTKEN